MTNRGAVRAQPIRPPHTSPFSLVHWCIAHRTGRRTIRAGRRTVASGNAIRGSRVGAGPMGEAERGETAPRIWISFYCCNGHETKPSFASGPDRENPPAPPRTEPYKTHLAYVRERRSDEDGEAILAEALAKLRGEV